MYDEREKSNKPKTDEDGFETVSYAKKTPVSLSTKIDRANQTTGELSSEEEYGKNGNDDWNMDEEDEYWRRF